ncbi:MAG: sulfite exporter TauE/SafE family protein [Chloroflexi bacterium]|nr:sulfite exporter TauE/SafE family protein [Chloroflexota bacterium]
MAIEFSFTLVLVASILFFSTFIRSAVGFGDALLAMPLLALFISLRTATPLVGFMGMMISAGILITDWQMIDFRAAWRLNLASFAGIPLGLLLITLAPEAPVKIILGLLLGLYGLYNLMTPGLPLLQNERLAYPFGFVAGILGGAYNTSGPPIVIYGALRRWPPDNFRATLQGYFFFSSILILAGQGLAGLWTWQVVQLFLYSTPLMIFGIYLGGKVNGRLPKAAFRQIIFGLLIVVGILFLVSNR